MRRITAALAVCFAVGCDGGPQSDPATTVSRVVPEDAFLDVNDVRLHYLDWGGEGDLMLLVPGVTATAHVWNAVAPTWTDAYHVVAVTRREHGASEKPGEPVELDLLADDLAGVIDALSIEPAVVVGHSYAGLEMPRLYRRHPDKVRALIFVDAIYDGQGILASTSSPPGFGPPESAYKSIGDAVAWFRESFPSVAEDLATSYVRSQLRRTDAGGFTWQLPIPGPTLGAFFSQYGTWTPDDYAGITVPVMSIQAAQAKYYAGNLSARGYPADSVEAAVQWATFEDDAWKRAAQHALTIAVPGTVAVLLDSTSHMIPLERPDTLSALVGAFLRSHVRN